MACPIEAPPSIKFEGLPGAIFKRTEGGWLGYFCSVGVGAIRSRLVHVFEERSHLPNLLVAILLVINAE